MKNKGCEKQIEYKTFVDNGWNEISTTQCGWYWDGIKRFCEVCQLKVNKNI